MVRILYTLRTISGMYNFLSPGPSEQRFLAGTNKCKHITIFLAWLSTPKCYELALLVPDYKKGCPPSSLIDSTNSLCQLALPSHSTSSLCQPNLRTSTSEHILQLFFYIDPLVYPFSVSFAIRPVMYHLRSGTCPDHCHLPHQIQFLRS